MRHLCALMFSNIISNVYNKPSIYKISVDTKMYYIHVTKYYLANQKNAALRLVQNRQN